MILIYAKRFEDLPIVKHIGDIIRIHRANIKQFNEVKQFHVNVFFNSSWCLFPQNNDPKDADESNQGLSDNDSEDNNEGNGAEGGD